MYYVQFDFFICHCQGLNLQCFTVHKGCLAFSFKTSPVRFWLFFWLFCNFVFSSLGVQFFLAFLSSVLVFLTVLFDVHHSHSLTESGSLVQGQSDRQLFLLKGTQD
jgi:hypothetical protein